MNSTSSQKRKSSSDIKRERAVIRDALPAVLALLVAEAALMVADSGDAAEGWSVLLWLLPLLPAAWLVRVQMRVLRRADEFQRVQQLEAMAVGFAATLMLALAGSLIVAADPGVGQQAKWLQITFIGGTLSWLVALAVATRRDR